MFEGGPVLVPPLRAGQGQPPPDRRRRARCSTRWRRARRCRWSSSRGSMKSRQKSARGWRQRRRRCARSFVERRPRSWTRAPACRRRPPSRIVIRQCEGVLRPDVVLPFDDQELAGCTVGDVLADPERFEGETLADPLEGVDYGRCMREDHAPGRRHAVDPFVRPRPDHLRAQARRRQRAQGDGGGGEGGRGRDASPGSPSAPTSTRSKWRSCGSWPRSCPASACG